MSENDRYKCGRNGTLRHILSACPLGLKERYTWRDNEVLRVFKKFLGEKIADVNKGKLPTTEVKKKIHFHKKWQTGNVEKLFPGPSLKNQN